MVDNKLIQTEKPGKEIKSQQNKWWKNSKFEQYEPNFLKNFKYYLNN